MTVARETQALLGQAQALHDAGRLAEAAAGFRTVLAVDAQNWPSLVGLAAISLQSGQLDDAIRRFGALVERESAFVEGFYKRGNAYNRQGQLIAARVGAMRAARRPGNGGRLCAEAYWRSNVPSKPRGPCSWAQHRAG